MIGFILIAVANGVINIVNKMVNLQAKLKLGTANGTLINYLEGTVISFLAMLIIGGTQLTDFAYLGQIPPVYYLGGLFGLISMVLIMIGMSRNRVSFSTVIVLIGQLGAGLLIDSIVAHRVTPLKVLGIILVIVGVVIDKSLQEKQAKKMTV